MLETLKSSNDLKVVRELYVCLCCAQNVCKFLITQAHLATGCPIDQLTARLSGGEGTARAEAVYVFKFRHIFRHWPNFLRKFTALSKPRTKQPLTNLPRVAFV